jgi:hypothetical protein
MHFMKFRLVDQDLDALGLDPLHGALDRTLPEIVLSRRQADYLTASGVFSTNVIDLLKFAFDLLFVGRARTGLVRDIKSMVPLARGGPGYVRLADEDTCDASASRRHSLPKSCRKVRWRLGRPSCWPCQFNWSACPTLASWQPDAE